MSCTSPIAFEVLVDYWAGELSDEAVERIDAHVMGCASCAAESEAVERIAAACRFRIPPVISADQLDALQREGLVVAENPCTPGARKEARFEPDVDLLVHRLGGLALAGATRVRMVVRSESSNVVMLEDDFVPFDRTRGEVLVACQRHFAAFPPDVVFEVFAHDDTGIVSSARYLVPHVFDFNPPR
ncbi:MAG TPA: zf-HC2 domain-containing protein [Nannocystaceae bacterium]|nr:zf-HC2 domain-containing protein [Nannocystaceae bacterium]